MNVTMLRLWITLSFLYLIPLLLLLLRTWKTVYFTSSFMLKCIYKCIHFIMIKFLKQKAPYYKSLAIWTALLFMTCSFCDCSFTFPPLSLSSCIISVLLTSRHTEGPMVYSCYNGCHNRNQHVLWTFQTIKHHYLYKWINIWLVV